MIFIRYPPDIDSVSERCNWSTNEIITTCNIQNQYSPIKTEDKDIDDIRKLVLTQMTMIHNK